MTAIEKPKTPWQRHLASWGSCEKCELAKTRSRVVLARGVIPADIVFCGEAPGSSEDTLGKPFCGPAGHKLDEIINAAIGDSEWHLDPPRIAFTNLVACLPLNQDGDKLAQPPARCIKACKPRLDEFIAIVKPKLIVRVGVLAEKHLPDSMLERMGIKHCDIIHPAAILRSNVAQRAFAIKKCIVSLTNAFEELYQKE